ncbi:phosphoribosyl 1,2-cyclic phosphate phosphodiesterase [Paenibacillus sp. UNC496MF]|uniref:MBL fold metallo-hydrolase n=1 Tax=Paenibacillus sp. UNC496MF TaxID=1502753 RepID=UPI0008F3377B|nr:MBL fold metallo-hydrolase [Paenibacillus sp. UNC496MF]SFJ55212.1 phosphoribosyl 1,2-cyclic phosphate phosphodiesterase [Paenibacillus sp. UNC496MF]
MNMTFLGTGAAEGVPSYFCRCTLCSRIREAGGRNIRSRTSFRIDAQHQIDFSPDIFYQMIKLGLDVYDMEHLLITHTHKDHFAVGEIMSKLNRIEHNNRPLHVYLSEPAAEWSAKLLAVYDLDATPGRSNWDGKFIIHPLRYFESYDVGRLKVTTVPGNHYGMSRSELAINYLIELPDGRKLLYASDTGWYTEATWRFLEGKSVDLLIMECTFGNREGYPKYADSHLDIPNYALMPERMKEIEFVHEHTRVWATHINTAHHLLHDEMQAEFDRSGHRVVVAYDGLAIDADGI